MSQVIKYGKHKVDVYFDDKANGETVVFASLGEFEVGVGGVTPQSIAGAVRAVVDQYATAQQAQVERQRALEDAKRLLGN